MEEYRLDVYLLIKGLTESREKAKQLITNNCVYVNNKLSSKPSLKVCDLDIIDIKNNFDYVSRGASKLEKAIEYFNIIVENKTAVDIGASTGGFTDYLIKNKAKKVYAIDVGHDQLHESLRNNENVINLEKTNFRYMDTSILKENIDIIVVDVSFISLRLIFPKIAEITHDNTDIIVLIKPQFEAGRHNIGKNGILKDKKVHLNILNNIQMYCDENHMSIISLTFSPIKGGDGNIEYLGHIKKNKQQSSIETEHKIKDLIKEAFDYYKNK